MLLRVMRDQIARITHEFLPHRASDDAVASRDGNPANRKG
jgi:hypothetical protein